MSQAHKVAHINDIPIGSIKSFVIDYEKIVVCHTQKGIFAVEDCCSHDSAPISSGHLDSEGRIVCPRHGAKFDCQTGDVVAPPAVVGISTYEIKIENDEIYVILD